jgi:hypothetical protein
LQQAAQDADDAAEIAGQLSWQSMGSELEAKVEAARQVAQQNVVWFTLSGVVLGSAFGYAMAHLLNRNK